MNIDFHYYATYCAALLAEYSHEQSMEICYSAQFVDLCSKTLLSKLKAPTNAATTQLQTELADTRTDIIGLQDITRIWSSFHFLPYDLYAVKPHRTKAYMRKYRLICKPNSDLLVKTVNLARGGSLQHIGIAMHILADTWAHAYFAGTPSLVINNMSTEVLEVVTDEEGNETEQRIKFKHTPGSPDDIENRVYTNTIYQGSETSIMNLGHGRAGHLPDYSFIRYTYLPAWDGYRKILKDNPAEYYKAFTQMVYALKTIREGSEEFRKDIYDEEVTAPYKERIKRIISTRQISASQDWKEFGEELSGCTVDDFDINKYQDEYINASADDKDKTFLGRFIKGALAQKGMVTDSIVKSGNPLAGMIRFKISKLKGAHHV